jgi:hypothetical protein
MFNLLNQRRSRDSGYQSRSPRAARGAKMRTRDPSASGFALNDLTAALAAVLLLLLVVVASAAATRNAARGAICLSNQAALVRAWKLYALDNDRKLVGNLDGGAVMAGSNSNATWVLGWLDFSGGLTVANLPGPSNTNTALLTLYSPLAPYLGRVASVFKCPADTSLSFGTRGAPRVRSVSMNGYVGARSAPWNAGYRQMTTMDAIHPSTPAETFVFIEEREDSINDGWFIVDMSGFDPPNPGAHRLVDFPADWHDRGLYLSFADGHAEYWRWQDPRTMPRHRRGSGIVLGVASPNNPDVTRLQAATTRRVPSP